MIIACQVIGVDCDAELIDLLLLGRRWIVLITWLTSNFDATSMLRLAREGDVLRDDLTVTVSYRGTATLSQRTEMIVGGIVIL